MFKFKDVLIDLGLIKKKIPKGDHVLVYYPGILFRSPNLDRDLTYEQLKNRIPYKKSPTLGLGQPDIGIYHSIADTMAKDDPAYKLACKRDPELCDLIELATRKLTWGNLTGIKFLLAYSPKLAKEYRGFLPFGQDVTNWFNQYLKKTGNSHRVGSTPNKKDYLLLRDETNGIADLTGMSTILINHLMYFEGSGR